MEMMLVAIVFLDDDDIQKQHDLQSSTKMNANYIGLQCNMDDFGNPKPTLCGLQMGIEK